MNIQNIKKELLFQALYGKEKVNSTKVFESAINAVMNKIFEAQKKEVKNG